MLMYSIQGKDNTVKFFYYNMSTSFKVNKVKLLIQGFRAQRGNDTNDKPSNPYFTM